MPNNLAYQDDFEQKRRRELIDGQPVMMSPRPTVNHNRVIGNIFGIFQSYLKGRGCVPFSDGVDLFLDDKNLFVPDFMVVCDRKKIQQNGIHGAPDLVVEVLSPSTAKNDRSRKKEIYARFGVPEYWIVSPNEKSIEVYRLSGSGFTLHDVYTIYADWQLEQMTVEERAAVTTEFNCHLFDDLVIHLDDIFNDLF